MSTPILESAFTTGEVAPALFGNVQLARMHAAASTMRNFFVGYQGGAYSRAGTAFVGFSKQTGRAYPPRVISFQFSINQGLALEFGNFYMRVIFDGAYVTEAPYVITNATQASPCVLTISPTSTLDSVTPINSAVSASYVPGDTVSLAGGTFSTRAVARVAYTQLSSIAVNAPGSNYAAGGLITLNGGSPIVRPVVRIATAKVVSVAAIENAGSGGTPGAAVLTGTTGTGTKVQLNVTIGGLGQLVSINSIAVAGSYSVDPYTAIYGFETDQLSGGGFAAPPYVLYRMGVDTVSVVDPGQFFANGTTFTQYSSNGSGSGATFNTPVFGVYSATVLTPGEYTVLPTNPVAQFGTSGTGVGVTFTAAWSSSPSIATGDWFFVQGVGGMTEINNQTFVASVAGANLSLFDVYGNPIDSTLFTAYTSGGTASRIYTLATQFSEQDLDWIKATESADTMSLCCVNQQTGTEYPPVDLTRFADDNWVLTTVVATPSLSAPTGASVTVTPQPATPVADAGYSYVVTALNSDGTESIASNIASVADQTDIGATAGTATIAWSGVIGANKYFVYKATPVLVPHGTGSHVPPTGSPFGYVGYAFGSRFMDTNIIPDFTQVPPLHKNPFARGQILSLTPGAGGSGYTSTPTATINTFTGGGAVILPVVDAANTVVSYIVQDGGQNYAPTDTVTISGGGGSGATATLVLGPQTGTYPGVVAYFQQRRTYAYTINQPDTYFMSQPGLFLNFDTRDPTIPSDAITGTPWSVQVNGIQFMVPIGGALMVLTGLEAYLLTGEGGSTFTPQPLTPSSQSAQNQGFNGCSATVPPVRIYQDVLYVQAKGSTYRDFSFDVSKYSYTGDDITQAATQLFTGYTIKQHAWCEEPYRVLWAVRSDGVLLSLTWMKTEKVCGWARHDTFGSVKSLCSVTEPPVDALYLAVQRNIGEHTAYTIERMNNRIWNSVEDAWCVDCGFSLPMDKPAATLTASSSTGLGALTGVTGLVGGSGYSSATTATITDDNGEGPGSGAVAALTIVGGVITGVHFTSNGSGYINPRIDFSDPAGSQGGTGASAHVTLDNSATFTADAAVFAIGDVGSVIRLGGGTATIIAYTDPQHVTANISTPISQTYPDSTGARVVIPQTSGNWTLSAPITTVGGLNALIGATVTGLADGIRIPPQVVAADGTIVLPAAASQVTVGLGFQAQLQSVYLDAGEPTIQGQRKVLSEGTARILASGPFKMGSNQPDGSTLSPPQIAPVWSMQDAPITTKAAYNSSTVPLCTDDIRIPINSGFSKHGQICVQQDNPYPLNVLAFIPEVLTGDQPSQGWPQKKGKGG